MAIGAVLFSLPAALIVALYGYVVQNVTMYETLLVYSGLGTVSLLSFVLIFGLKFDDLR